jgi:hypothetical protein
MQVELLMFVLTPADGFCCVWFIYPVNWVGFYLRTETESSLRNVVFKIKTGRWIMSKRLIIAKIIAAYSGNNAKNKYSLWGNIQFFNVKAGGGTYSSHWALEGIINEIRTFHNKCETIIDLSAVDIATGYGLDGRRVGIRVPVGVRFIHSPLRLDRFWGPPSLISYG